MVWRAVGAGLLTVLPALVYTLKASAPGARAGVTLLLCQRLPRQCLAKALLCMHAPPAHAHSKTCQRRAVYSAQDKAENDLLARPLARTLNLGLMACSIGHLLIFGPILNHVRC